MDLLQLQAFVQVSLLGSFTRASSALGVTQPVLSRRIRGLELELKQPLLMRTGRGVELTEAGRRLLTHGQEILGQVERAKLDVREARGSLVGHVTLSIPASIGPIITIEIIRHFRERFPRATLSITESPSTQTNEWISTGRVDVAVVYSPISSARVEVELLLKQSLSLIGPARGEWLERGGDSIGVQELPGYPVILPTRHHSVRMYIESSMTIAGVRPNVVWEIDSFNASLELVRAVSGYTIVPESVVRWYVNPREIKARRLVEPELTIPLALLWPAARAVTPLARQTLELIRELVPTLLAEPLDSAAPKRSLRMHQNHAEHFAGPGIDQLVSLRCAGEVEPVRNQMTHIDSRQQFK